MHVQGMSKTVVRHNLSKNITGSFSSIRKISNAMMRPLSEPQIITLVIALWGAATGTVAVFIQVVQHFADRPKLDVKASMSQRIDRVKPIARLSVDVEVCNHGRRPVTIDQVGVILPDKPNADPNVLARRTHAQLFDAESKGEVLRLGEGDKKTFRYDFFPQQHARALWKKGKTARVFVKLTNGEEHFATYYLIDPAAFPPEQKPS